jgi:hypothetical protein
MTKDTLKMVLVLCVLTGLVVGVCGCTNPVQTAQNAVSPSNKAIDYGNAFVNNEKQNPGENCTVTSSSVVANGSDAALMTVAVKNSTHDPTSLWRNGTTDTFAFNIKQFSSTDEATTFYNTQSFGLTPQPASNVSSGQTNVVNPYEAVTGHNATTINAAMKLESFNFISASADLVTQTNEFVIYGTISVTGV